MSLIESLPTPVALTLRRVYASNPEDAGSRFLYLSYSFEIILKALALISQSALRAKAFDDGYRIAYRLVRASGLGDFQSAIREAMSVPLVTFMPAQYRPLIAWCTKKRSGSDDEWFQSLARGVRKIFELMPTEDRTDSNYLTVIDVLGGLTNFRNKTKAHGALGDDFFTEVNESYEHTIDQLMRECPAFQWRWVHLSRTEKGKIRGISLKGAAPSSVPAADVAQLHVEKKGIYLWLPDDTLSYLGDLIQCNAEATRFQIINGAYNDQKQIAEFIDYGTGATQNHSVAAYSTPPAPLPRSETAALVDIDVQSNTFGNLPATPANYVVRTHLEKQLSQRLCDDNHTIITLHGPGGIGKTSLALAVTNALAAAKDPRFEYIVWFSSRDIDLRPSGPTRVEPDIVDLEAVARQFGRLFNRKGTLSDFAAALEKPMGETGPGTLFVFDNFETLSDAKGFHQFLDEHTHIPNKVLITSRYRAFKADFPIEVKGMEISEARQLMLSVGRSLSIEGLLTEKVIESVYSFTDGHAYVMRVLIGEIQKQGRYVPMPQVMAYRSDIVDAVFERSFSGLSDAGRNVFLLVANWQSYVSELALLTVLSPRGLEVPSGIDECKRLSLILEEESVTSQPFYSVPKLARIFGKKKLKGDQDYLQLQEDLNALHAFGSIEEINRDPNIIRTQVDRFVKSCIEEAENGADSSRLDTLLTSVAQFWPPAWLEVAKFRLRFHKDSDIAYALRRAVEEEPLRVDAWLLRADVARQQGADATYMSSLVNATEANPNDIDLLDHVASELLAHIDAKRIPRQSRGLYVRAVRDRMERAAHRLNADQNARLGWLYLIEAGTDKALLAKALEAANRGLDKDPGNPHCKSVRERVEASLSYL